VIAAGGGAGPGLLDALILGIVEGVTEFLPVSSTGHLIVAQRLLGLSAGPANNLFVVGIQMGAITAILVLYGRRLWQAACTLGARTTGQPNLLLQIACAALPAIVLGLFCDDWIDARLFTPGVVATTMVVGGVLLLLLEAWLRGRDAAALELAAVRYRTAFAIGLFQCLALLPGTSRSAATIGGALLLGLSRPAAAEFSFLVGLPILYGAGVLKVAGHHELLHGDFLLAFAVGTAASFASALLVVGPFVRFLRRHTFVPFACYRLVGGALLAIAVLAGWLA
jgi:undecaprenyl-diphosphatase